MAYTIWRSDYLKPLLVHADDLVAFALFYQKATKKAKFRAHLPVLARLGALLAAV